VTVHSLGEEETLVGTLKSASEVELPSEVSLEVVSPELVSSELVSFEDEVEVPWLKEEVISEEEKGTEETGTEDFGVGPQPESAKAHKAKSNAMGFWLFIRNYLNIDPQ
jgi:hypothetical protein